MNNIEAEATIEAEDLTMDDITLNSDDDASSPTSRRSSRAVSFSDTTHDLIVTEPWNSVGISDESVAEGKLITRALRYRFPGLPKFSYFDDENEAAIAERAANQAREIAVRRLQQAERTATPESFTIMPCTSGRKSRGSPGEFVPCGPLSVLAAAAAAATAAVTARLQEKHNIGAATPSVAEQQEKRSSSSSCRSMFARCKSVELPMSLRLQRFDSVADAHSRLRGPGDVARSAIGMAPTITSQPEPMAVG